MKNRDHPLQRLRELDQRRPSVPGEHWIAFGVGLYFLARQRPTSLGRIASTLVGGAFIARALSGRDGALAHLRDWSAAGRPDIATADPLRRTMSSR